MRDVNEIIVHCFATKDGWFRGKPFLEKVAEVKRWHLARGFSDIGYHYLISREGEVVAGRPLEKSGAHCNGHNKNSIGISLEGGWGKSRRDAFLDNYTVKQGSALLGLIDRLQHDHGELMISGHYKYANKECPAFNLPEFLSSSPLESAKPKFKPSKTGVAVGGIAMAVALFFDKIKEFFNGLF